MCLPQLALKYHANRVIKGKERARACIWCFSLILTIKLALLLLYLKMLHVK